MRFAVFFGALAAVFVWLAVQLGLPSFGGVAGLLTAMGLMGPTVAYGLGKPGVIGKQPDGTHPGWAQFVHGSYLGLCRFSAAMARLRGLKPWNDVGDGIVLGARPMPREVGTLLDDHGVGAVVDLTCELVDPARLRKNTVFLCLPTLDGTPLTAEQLSRGVDFIDAQRGQHAVYVHCAVGRGRSATLVVAWALAAGKADSVEAAEAWLKERRPAVRLGASQKAAVAAWWARRGVADS